MDRFSRITPSNYRQVLERKGVGSFALEKALRMEKLVFDLEVERKQAMQYGGDKDEE